MSYGGVVSGRIAMLLLDGRLGVRVADARIVSAGCSEVCEFVR